MIYIDPPYNTGKNLIYRNDFSMSEKEYIEKSGVYDEYNNRLFTNTQSNGRFHSDWCSMIYARLSACRSLLSSDGIICLTIDDSEIENVTKIMNEVFGESNHLATIIVKNNPSGRSTTRGASIAHEYALFYGKNEETTLGRLPRNEAQIARYKEKDSIGNYEVVNFRARYTTVSPKMAYPIFIKKDCSAFRIPNIIWNADNKTYDLLENPMNDEIISLPYDKSGKMRSWKWSIETFNQKKETDLLIKKDSDGNPSVYMKARMNDEGMLPLTVWDETKYSSTEYGANLLKRLFGTAYFDYPKSLYAVIDSLKVGRLNSDSIVLDFFSGSATTAHAIMQLNAEDGGSRKYICVQLPEKTATDSEAYKAGYKNICDIAKERIRRAGKRIKEESPLTAQFVDTGFRVFKCDESNMKDVYFAPNDYSQGFLSMLEDNIKEDRTDIDLLFDCMLRWGVELSLPLSSKKVGACTIHNVNDGDLVACFDGTITDDVIDAIADMSPLRVVFRDSSFEEASQKMNLFEIFKQKCGWSDYEVKNNVKVI